MPALLPSLMSEWSLNNTEAGWVTGFLCWIRGLGAGLGVVDGQSESIF
ncbi:MAG: hypothetical protein ACPGQV_08955 [Alphaproteobacteria bacterium]